MKLEKKHKIPVLLLLVSLAFLHIICQKLFDNMVIILLSLVGILYMTSWDTVTITGLWGIELENTPKEKLKVDLKARREEKAEGKTHIIPIPTPMGTVYVKIFGKTIAGITARVRTNSSITNTIIGLMINGRISNIQLSIGGGLTGDFIDATNTDIFTNLEEVSLFIEKEGRKIILPLAKYINKPITTA